MRKLSYFIIIFISFSFLAISASPVKSIIPMFHITGDNYDGVPSSEVDLNDSLNGKKDWINYLKVKYPGIAAVIYTIAPETLSGAKEIKFENAIQAANHLGLRVYLCYSWVNYLHPQEIAMQKNNHGEISNYKPAIQEKKNSDELETFVYKTVKKYQPDGIFLDHFRYEHRNWGYSDLFIQAFEREYPYPLGPSWTFDLLVSHTVPGKGDYFDEWITFREKELGELIGKVVDAAKKASRKTSNDTLQIAMFVGTSGEHHIRETIHGYGQLNKQNLKKAGINILAPMSYSVDPKLSFYQTASMRPFGFKLWGTISADDKRFPQDSATFREAIKRQFQICDRLIIYEDMFIDDDEMEVIKEFNKKSVSAVQSELVPKVFCVYTNSDLEKIEGQWWWAAYFSVIEDLLENDYYTQFIMLDGLIEEIERKRITSEPSPVMVFVSPYQFSSVEEQSVTKLREYGFNLIVINPNNFFSKPFATSKTIESKSIDVVINNVKSTLGNYLSRRMGCEIEIARKVNYIQGFSDVNEEWSVDSKLNNFALIISKNYKNRKEIITGLTPKTKSFATDEYGKLITSMVEWIFEEK